MRAFIILALGLFFCIVTCKRESVIKLSDSSEMNQYLLENYLSQFNLVNKTKCIIIPGSGCSGCIEQSYNHLIQNKDNTDILYVLTRIDDIKLVRSKLEINKMNIPENIIFDTNNDLLQIGYTSIYPVFLLLEKGKIVKVEILRPNNIDILMNL